MIVRLLHNLFDRYEWLTARVIAYTAVGVLAILMLMFPQIIALAIVLFVLVAPLLYATDGLRRRHRVRLAVVLIGGYTTVVSSMLVIAVLIPEQSAAASIIIGSQLIGLGVLTAAAMLYDMLAPVIGFPRVSTNFPKSLDK